jgi:hypothetical protein
MSNFTPSMVARSTSSTLRNSAEFSSGGFAASAALRTSSTGFTGLILKVSPPSPSILRRSKTTLAAVTFVARPVLSRVKTSFSPWYIPPVAGNANTFSPSSFSTLISVCSMRAQSLPSRS